MSCGRDRIARVSPCGKGVEFRLNCVQRTLRAVPHSQINAPICCRDSDEIGPLHSTVVHKRLQTCKPALHNVNLNVYNSPRKWIQPKFVGAILLCAPLLTNLETGCQKVVDMNQPLLLIVAVCLPYGLQSQSPTYPRLCACVCMGCNSSIQANPGPF